MVKDENGDVMSKSKGNVVPPSSVIGPYGADTMRLAILFIAPPEKDFDWDPKAVAGANRFIKRAWNIVWQLSQNAEAGEVDHKALKGTAAELFRTLNGMGLKCTSDFDRGQFNTAISAVMEIVNAASKYVNDDASVRDAHLDFRVANDIVAMLAPICPHWAEELYHEALHLTGSVYNEPWPAFDAELRQGRRGGVIAVRYSRARSAAASPLPPAPPTTRWPRPQRPPWQTSLRARMSRR